MADFIMPTLEPSSSDPFNNLAAMNTNAQRTKQAGGINALIDALAKKKLMQDAQQAQAEMGYKNRALGVTRQGNVLSAMSPEDVGQIIPDLAGLNDVVGNTQGVDAVAELRKNMGAADLADKKAGTVSKNVETTSKLADIGYQPNDMEASLDSIINEGTTLAPRPGGSLRVEEAGAKAAAEQAVKPTGEENRNEKFFEIDPNDPSKFKIVETTTKRDVFDETTPVATTSSGETPRFAIPKGYQADNKQVPVQEVKNDPISGQPIKVLVINGKDATGNVVKLVYNAETKEFIGASQIGAK